jgi:hypothetical protein
MSIRVLNHLINQRLDPADQVFVRDQALDMDQAYEVRLGGGLARFVLLIWICAVISRLFQQPAS